MNSDGYLLGVCEHLGQITSVPAVAWRAIFIFAFIFGVAPAILIYIILAFIL